MTTRPIEPPDGQDGPPDLATALHAMARYLADAAERFDTRPEDHDLALRGRAIRRALQRLMRHQRDDQ